MLPRAVMSKVIICSAAYVASRPRHFKVLWFDTLTARLLTCQPDGGGHRCGSERHVRHTRGSQAVRAVPRHVQQARPRHERSALIKRQQYESHARQTPKAAMLLMPMQQGEAEECKLDKFQVFAWFLDQ